MKHKFTSKNNCRKVPQKALSYAFMEIRMLLENLESTKEAKLLRFSRALQSSHVHP